MKAVETLGEYIERVIRQKNLSPKDVAKASGITNSYIGRIIRGKGENLTIGTILALAKGLDVDPHEVFTAASGNAPEGGAVDPLLIVDLLQKLLTNPEGLDLLQDWLKLTDKNKKTFVKFLKSLHEQQPKKKPKRK